MAFRKCSLHDRLVLNTRNVRTGNVEQKIMTAEQTPIKIKTKKNKTKIYNLPVHNGNKSRGIPAQFLPHFGNFSNVRNLYLNDERKYITFSCHLEPITTKLSRSLNLRQITVRGSPSSPPLSPTVCDIERKKQNTTTQVQYRGSVLLPH